MHSIKESDKPSRPWLRLSLGTAALRTSGAHADRKRICIWEDESHV